MSTHSVAHKSAQPEVNSPPLPDFLNPLAHDGTKGAVGMARRRLGILLAALHAEEETHPAMSPESIRGTLLDELYELDGILEVVEGAL